MNIRLMAASATLSIFGALMHEANAAAAVSLCNDGGVMVKAIIINNREDQIAGWYELEPNSCGAMTSGGVVDITVGFFPPHSADSEPGRIKYYDFEPPKLYKPGLSWVPADDAYVEKSTRWACAYKPDAFKRSGSRAELESCPNDEWARAPFVWHVWAYPNNDRYYNLHFEPSDDLIKTVRNK